MTPDEMRIIQLKLWRLCSCFTVIFNFFKRLLWRSRDRRNSDTPLPSHSSGTVPVQAPAASGNEPELTSWTDWGDGPTSVEVVPSNAQHGNSDEEPEPDYFQDMAPQIKRPTKIVVKKKMHSEPMEDLGSLSSRLSASTDAGLLPVSSELETWTDDGNAWEEDGDSMLAWEAEAAIREQRQAERERRHADQQRRKQEMEAQRVARQQQHRLAVKLSS
ncbi:receptor-binding cancer antigen expressed on SiSo cells-like isoform X2 [Branchiostoma lanceolatum]|uniref:receptor-binding cancer antigen expressed on SiSo cells-like isoform X2 n=2 Tax=Branchiostoma lanceolatum TaxID=7740 RepID=UPI00345602BF